MWIKYYLKKEKKIKRCVNINILDLLNHLCIICDITTIKYLRYNKIQINSPFNSN